MGYRFAPLLFAASVALSVTAEAQKAVILVRHAEKISETDERLTEGGRARAARLAAMLKDAGIGAVYSTDTERTIGTVKPLADALGLRIRIYDTGGGPGRKVDSSAFIEGLRKGHAGDVVLVASHSNTLPDLVRALGCPVDLRILPDEYDNLFVVVPGAGGVPVMLRLRY